MFVSALSFLALSAPQAQAVDNGSVLIGVGYRTAERDDPQTMRLSLRSELPVTSPAAASLGIVLPLSLATSGESGFGWSTQTTAVELAPSLRLRLFSDTPVRPYADLGLGAIWRFSETDTWFGDGSSRQFGPMTRSALGLELGGYDPGTVAFVVEPFSFQRYGFSDQGASRFSSMIGVSGNF